MKLASNVLLKALGLLLLTAAILKGRQLLTEPVANNDIWSYRPFLILTVEFELALAIWLLSGLFKKAAWLVSLLCFSFFSAITFYKAVAGFASCGCFGSVHVNPWITFFAIDLPSVIALSILRPTSHCERSEAISRLSFPTRRESIKAMILTFFTPLPSFRRFATAFAIGLTILGVTTPILALNEPAKITTRYEVLEPSEWIGKELPILEYIVEDPAFRGRVEDPAFIGRDEDPAVRRRNSIREILRTGTWLILLYHYDCPDCGTAIPKYEQMARDLAGNEDFLRIALIAIPPYGRIPVSEKTPCTLGRLPETKEWFVTTPAVALLTDGKVTAAWEEKAPDLDEVLQNFAKKEEKYEESQFFASTNQLTHSPQ
jgi:hypothetical protein